MIMYALSISSRQHSSFGYRSIKVSRCFLILCSMFLVVLPESRDSVYYSRVVITFIITFQPTLSRFLHQPCGYYSPDYLPRISSIASLFVFSLALLFLVEGVEALIISVSSLSIFDQSPSKVVESRLSSIGESEFRLIS